MLKGTVGLALGAALGAGLAWLLPYAPLWYVVLGVTLLVHGFGRSSQSSDTAGARLFMAGSVGVSWYAVGGGEHRFQVLLGWVVFLCGSLGLAIGAEWGEGGSGGPSEPSAKDIERCREIAVAAFEHDFAGQEAIHSKYPRIRGGPVVFRFRVGGRAVEYGVDHQTFSVQRLEASG